MAQHYTLTGFLRQASNKLLSQYFAVKRIELGIDHSKLKARDADPIIKAIDVLSLEKRGDLERDFPRVASMDSKAGIGEIRSQAAYRGINLDAGLKKQKSRLNAAFWTFLNHPEIFEGAVGFAMPHLAGRYWKRALPVVSAPNTDLDGKVAALETAVSDFFRREEGRGRACKVDYVPHPPRHRFHAYPEDFPDAPLAWTAGRLAPHPYRPAFEVVFVYDELEGSLDVYFEGGRPIVERLWQLFAETVLGAFDLPEPAKPAFGLGALKSRTTAFVRDPDSPIVDLRVKGLTFVILGGGSTTIRLETDVSRDPDALQAVIDRTFARGPGEPGRYSLSQAKVIGARIQATINPRDGGRLRTRTFNLSEKNCDLKHDGTDLELRKIMIDSGIDRTGGAGIGLADVAAA